MQTGRRLVRLAAGMAFSASVAGGAAIGALANDRDVTADEFDARTQGLTLYFDLEGSPYGAEQYMRNRQVRWQGAGGQCLEGYWYGEGSEICFVYDNGRDGAQCWRVFDRGGVLFAQLRGVPLEDAISASKQDDNPLNCPGPDLGV